MTTKKPLIGFLIFSALTLASTAAVFLLLPHEREVGSLYEFVAKLVPFILAVEAIARLEPAWARKLRLVTVFVPIIFLVYFAYFVPRIFYYGGVVVDQEDAFPALYYNILLLTPLLILSLVLAYRLGGGRAGTARRLGFGLLLIMLSGIEDLAFLTVNDLRGTPFHPIPDEWSWASHMEVRLGHVASKEEAFVFIAVHLALAALVLFFPDRWSGLLRRSKEKTAAPVHAHPSTDPGLSVTATPDVRSGRTGQEVTRDVSA